MLASASGLIHSDDSQIGRSSSSSLYESKHCRDCHPNGHPSSTCNSPSTASWLRPTPIPNPSSGPPTPNASSPPSNVGSKCWSQSTSLGLPDRPWHDWDEWAKG